MNKIISDLIFNHHPFTISGGEDYELIFTAPQRLMSKIIANIKTPVSVIGEIVKKNKQTVTIFDPNGKVVQVKSTGWDHLS